MRKRTKIWGCIFLAVTFFLASDLLVRAETHLELANEYAAQSEEFFEKAVSEYNLALKEAEADKFQINFLLGRLYYRHGKFKEAIQTLLPLYEREREDFALAKFLAFSYYKNGDYTDLYFILKEKANSLEEIITFSEKKYGSEFDPRLFLEQLIYLKDVEEIEIEFLKERVIMPDIEKFFEGEVRKIKF